MIRDIHQDEAVVARVKDALAHEPQIDMDNLRVEVKGGTVRLYGITRSLQAVRRAGEVAAQVPGVTALDNMLAVEEPRGRGDGQLQEAAATAVANAGADNRISIEVSDGLAILRGEVENPSVDDPVIAALEKVPGLKGIRNDVLFQNAAEARAPFDQLPGTPR
jgi:osmotically-inducible protein OsmY